jgi:hypothetical protein
VHARETEIELARAAELAARMEAEEHAATEKAKAAAVLDREVRALESMTAEDVETKVRGVSDIETLRAMVCKLLYTRVKRAPPNETPAQRAARLRKESTPKLLRNVLARAEPERLLPLKQLARQVLEIYLCKIVMDDQWARHEAANPVLLPTAGSTTSLVPSDPAARLALTPRRGASVHGFLYEWMQQRFGLRSIAEHNLAELLRSVQVYLHPDRPAHRRFATSLALNSADMLDRSARVRLLFFARMANLYADAPLLPEAAEFFLYALKVVQEAAAQSVPASFSAGAAASSAASGGKDGGSSSAVVTKNSSTANDASRAMLRVLELACVPLGGSSTTSSGSARASGRRSSLPDQSGLVTSGGGTTPSAAAMAALHARQEELDSAGGGSIGLHVPLFLAQEALAHAFRQLGYSDDGMDIALRAVEKDCTWPVAAKSGGAASASNNVERQRSRLLLKQIIARQMLRASSVGGGSQSAQVVFDRFDSDRSGLVTVQKLRALIPMDEDTANQLADMLAADKAAAAAAAQTGGSVGSGPGGITAVEVAQALHTDYRLCVPLDTLLERATNTWLAEHTALTKRYQQACAEAAGPHGQGLLNSAEFFALLQALEPPPASSSTGSAPSSASSSSSSSRVTRPFANKLFREGLEMERRAAAVAAVVEAAREAREQALSRKSKKGRRARRASASPSRARSPSPSPLARTASIDATAGTATATADASSSAAAVPADLADGAANAAAGSSTDASASAASDASAAGPPVLTRALSSGTGAVRPSLMRKSSLAPTEFLTQATCLALLRKHRIGLPTPRKPFQEFKAFLRRYRNNQQQTSNYQTSGSATTRSTYSSASGAAATAASDPPVTGSEAAAAVEQQPPQPQPPPLPPGVNSFDTILQAIIEE